MKYAIVTGGSSGIGKAVAEKFLQLGYSVILVDLNNASLENVKAEFGEYGEKILCAAVDVSKAESVKELAQSTKEILAGDFVLVNCAGVYRGGLLHEAPEDDFDFQFNVNTKGIFLMMKEFIPLMLKNGGGAIVNIASLSGTRGDYNAPIYCASKGAVVSLTQAAALDYMEKGIRINCVSPSATATPMFLSGSSDQVIESFKNALPDHKIGLPEQVADAIVFLASDQAAHICGHNLPVDGGLLAWNGQPRQNKQQTE